MRLSASIPAIIILVALGVMWLVLPWETLFVWAAEKQRDAQEAMARALQAVRAQEPAALITLCVATATYGFVHALGPGHGKVVLGGAALASGATLRRMSLLTLAASLAQAFSAIAMVGIFAAIFAIGSRQLGLFADGWLAPLSTLAIAVMGLYLMLRGVGMWRKSTVGSCCHAHGPSVKETQSLTGFRDAAFLVASIAMRPCTGAIFVMVIALRFDVFWAGCLAVLAMGLGTAGFNLLVAWSGVVARRFGALTSRDAHEAQRISAQLHLMGGFIICAVSLGWLVSLVPGLMR
jgi:nickel/cobalt exporter